MRRIAVLGALVVAALLPARCASHAPRDLTIRRVAGNLFQITDGNGNMAVFVRADSVVLVDTLVPTSGQRILDQIRTVTDRPVTHILNTHTHADHVGSNAFFPAAVEIVAHERTAARMAGMPEFRDPADRHGLPDRTFNDRLTLFDGDDAIELRYFGAAHTDGDAFIVFRGPGVMHAGDTFPGVNVVARDGGSAAEYATTMGRAAASIDGVRTVISGHGADATWQVFIDAVAAMRQPGHAHSNAAARAPQYAKLLLSEK
jgi:glyoxylase-like metal-dependent hydrolase (beta-lactamase superfamily II)